MRVETKTRNPIRDVTHKDYERYKRFIKKFDLSSTEYARKLKKWCERHGV